MAWSKQDNKGGIQGGFSNFLLDVTQLYFCHILFSLFCVKEFADIFLDHYDDPGSKISEEDKG
jgi:hypothetical protein